MDFHFRPEQELFRREVRDFLEQELGPGDPEGVEAEGFSRAFSKKLAGRGWIGLAWPKEYGGRDLGPIERLVYTEEMSVRQAPWAYHHLAESQVGPSLIRHGTEEQRRALLPRIVNADVSFCLGLSEPGAGSDLASVTTRAVRDGDVYVVNGQKIWTSFAHLADMCWLVVRTNPDAPKHRGISVLLLDMRTPGITVRPLVNMGNQHHFNEVFFDNVRVPVQNRVGEEDRGWYLLAEHLDFERSGIERIVRGQRLLQELIGWVRSWSEQHPERARARVLLANLALEIEVGRLLAYRVAWLQSRGQVPNHEASMSKLYGSEWVQRVASAGVRIAGMHAVAAGADAAFPQHLRARYLAAVPLTIAGGTSEIQRGIIAQRGLGLPRA